MAASVKALQQGVSPPASASRLQLCDMYCITAGQGGTGGTADSGMFSGAKSGTSIEEQSLKDNLPRGQGVQDANQQVCASLATGKHAMLLLTAGVGSARILGVMVATARPHEDYMRFLKPG